MAVKETNHRITATITEDEFQQVSYWAKRHGISLNEYFREAVEEKIKRENGDYELPTLEQQRLNQLCDLITVLSSDVQSLEQVVTSGFDSLIGLTRGDNYLLQNEDGDI